MSRGQATLEHAALLLLAAVLALGAIAAFRKGPPPDLGRALLPRISRRHLTTPDERALASPTLRPLILRALPRLVLERDGWGSDDEVPVRDSCRTPACARFGSGARPALFVHVVHRRAGPVVELWTYYPDSRTDHLPLSVLQGYHRDDWEGLLVAFDVAGHLIGARASAHAGFNGSEPWWAMAREDWAPYARVAYRASGSHALSLTRDDIDLAGDRWSGDLGVVEPASFELVAADRASRTARAYAEGAVPPWQKRAWLDPGVEHTGPPGAGPSLAAAAARVWAAAERAA
jgi:hypothetical protein